MALQDRYNFDDLVNEAERIVLNELERQLGDGIEAVSEDEILDMAAYALNSVRPRYRVNLLGRLYARSTDSEYEAEVQDAVAEAVSKVRSDQ
jgi:competence protein ComFB